MGIVLARPRTTRRCCRPLTQRASPPPTLRFRCTPDAVPVAAATLPLRGLRRAAVMEFLTFVPRRGPAAGRRETPRTAVWDAISRTPRVWVSSAGRRACGPSPPASAGGRGLEGERGQRARRRADDAETLMAVVERLSSTLARLEGEASWTEWRDRLCDAYDEWVDLRGPHGERLEGQAVREVLLDLGALGGVSPRAAWADVAAVLEARFEEERMPLEARASGAVHVGALDAWPACPPPAAIRAWWRVGSRASCARTRPPRRRREDLATVAPPSRPAVKRAAQLLPSGREARGSTCPPQPTAPRCAPEFIARSACHRGSPLYPAPIRDRPRPPALALLRGRGRGPAGGAALGHRAFPPRLRGRARRGPAEPGGGPRRAGPPSRAGLGHGGRARHRRRLPVLRGLASRRPAPVAARAHTRGLIAFAPGERARGDGTRLRERLDPSHSAPSPQRMAHPRCGSIPAAERPAARAIRAAEERKRRSTRARDLFLARRGVPRERATEGAALADRQSRRRCWRSPTPARRPVAGSPTRFTLLGRKSVRVSKTMLEGSRRSVSMPRDRRRLLRGSASARRGVPRRAPQRRAVESSWATRVLRVSGRSTHRPPRTA